MHFLINILLPSFYTDPSRRGSKGQKVKPADTFLAFVIPAQSGVCVCVWGGSVDSVAADREAIDLQQVFLRSSVDEFRSVLRDDLLLRFVGRREELIRFAGWEIRHRALYLVDGLICD